MKLEGSEAFERNFQIDETGKIQVRGLEKEANGKLNLSGTLVIQYEEYEEPVSSKGVRYLRMTTKAGLCFRKEIPSR